MRQMISESAAAIRDRIPDAAPRAAIIFGTGQSSLAAEIDGAVTVPYSDIPHFPRPTVETHPGELVYGTLEGCPVIAMKGRFHYYEGYTMQQITHPVRVLHALGAETLVVSNACGGMNPNFPKGDVCIIEDHINLIGDNPLIGPNDDTLGPRFPDMSRPYDPELIEVAERAALAAGIRTHRAVFVAVAGPNLETRAEYRFLRAIGADLVGMSTVPEVIVANHEGMRAVGFSIITDSCLPDALEPVSVDEIIAIAGAAEPKLNTMIKGVLAALAGA